MQGWGLLGPLRLLPVVGEAGPLPSAFLADSGRLQRLGNRYQVKPPLSQGSAVSKQLVWVDLSSSAEGVSSSL